MKSGLCGKGHCVEKGLWKGSELCGKGDCVERGTVERGLCGKGDCRKGDCGKGDCGKGTVSRPDFPTGATAPEVCGLDRSAIYQQRRFHGNTVSRTPVGSVIAAPIPASSRD